VLAKLARFFLSAEVASSASSNPSTAASGVNADSSFAARFRLTLCSRFSEDEMFLVDAAEGAEASPSERSKA
jgi:hypothetical protein